MIKGYNQTSKKNKETIHSSSQRNKQEEEQGLIYNPIPRSFILQTKRRQGDGSLPLGHKERRWMDLGLQPWKNKDQQTSLLAPKKTQRKRGREEKIGEKKKKQPKNKKRPKKGLKNKARRSCEHAMAAHPR